MASLGRPRQAWVWHAELPVQESSTSVNLRHMYEPIRSGVVAGLQSYLHAHPLQGRSWNITSRVCSESVMLINAWRSPSRARRVLERKLQSLRAGDLFVWIGHASQMAVPVSMLRSNGVHTVYYQLEPIESCTIYALTRRTGMDRYNEVWDYSPTNSQVCRDSQLHLNDTVFRYVPVVALPDRVQAAQQPSEEKLAFLGTVAHRVQCNQPPLRGSTPSRGSMGNPVRRRRQPVPCNSYCKHRLEAWANEGWLQIEGSAWSDQRLAAVLQSYGVYVNVHKACNDVRNPVSPRVSMLLSARALVISEHCHDLDERQFEGMVSFVPFEDVSREFARLRAMSRAEREALAAMRAARFARRFAPHRVYEEAGVHELMRRLDRQLRVNPVVW